MEKLCDFVDKLGNDMSIKILLGLEDPCDLAKVSVVSKSWRRFVIENGLFKQLCLKLCPDVSKIIAVVEYVDKPERGTIRILQDPGFLEREHRVFSLLSHGLTQFPLEHLVKDAICASSTDRFPDERIENTLLDDDYDPEESEPPYWSSNGKTNRTPTVPESLVYKLFADLCLVSEIHVQPHQGCWEPGNPIYSAEAVRFCMGHKKNPLKPERLSSNGDVIYDDDMFKWTYTSPKFPMAREADVQKFLLPRPVLCFGGILKIELFGRVHKNFIDGLYYICVERVQAVGRRLGPVFDIDIIDNEGSFIMNHLSGVSDVRDNGRC